MRSIGGIIKRNKLYAGLAVFILLINLLVFAERFMPPAPEEQVPVVAEEPAYPEEKTLLEEEDIEARKARLKALAEENPKLYVFLGLFNLTIIFMAFLGLIIDIFLLARFFGKKPISIRMNEQEAPLWGVPDVVRVTLIFVAFGYIFAILQAFFYKVFPILNNENFRMVFNTAIMNVVGISVIFYFVVRKHGQRIKDLGLTSSRAGKGVLYAIVGYMALLPVLIAIMAATYFITEWLQYKTPVQPIVEVFIKEKGTLVLWMSTLFAAVFGPIAEEIFFRGFIYKALRKTIGVFWAILATAALFSFLHAHAVGFMPIMALGVLLAYLYEKTGSLVPSIAVHIIHNVGMVIMVFVVRNIG